MQLSPEQFARLKELFDEAVDLPHPDLEALIERARRDAGDEIEDQQAS